MGGGTPGPFLPCSNWMLWEVVRQMHSSVGAAAVVGGFALLSSAPTWQGILELEAVLS